MSGLIREKNPDEIKKIKGMIKKGIEKYEKEERKHQTHLSHLK